MPSIVDPIMSDSSETEEDLSKYEYTSLGMPQNIRLLNLRPGRKSKASEIVCELLEENIDKSRNEYEAVSWAWGTDVWDERIRIRTKGEDFYFAVPKSLTAALRALRDRKNARKLWIDAICINQEETDEKNQQVPMMAQIYGGATRVVCVCLSLTFR